MTEIFERKLWEIEEDSSPITLIALFVFFGLVSGVLMRALNKRTKIPYTPILLVIGMTASFCGDHIGLISKSTSIIAKIEPSGILLIFIPILIFESSFNADWHAFKKSLKQILLLAGPGIGIVFALIAFTLKIILGYSDDELSWSSALMIGAILAATDPVATIALLKELRAPVYFSTIVEGESLLNDGTGVVFFTIFSNFAAGNKVGIGLGISSFFILCIGGVALGFIFSFVTSFWLEKIFDDSILSISVTISASYLLYWVAETFTAHFTGGMEVGVSGILALCTLGLYLSAYGKIKIGSKIESPLHTVIKWTQYVSETLIFLLAGILAGKVFLAEEKSLHQGDWWKLLAFFGLLNLARGLMIGLFSPILNRVGPKLSIKELFILSYAGLRGALGIALALTVNVNTRRFSARTRELVLFYVVGTAALSLLVNGTTTGLVVKKIKMLNVFPAKEKVFRSFRRELAGKTRKQYQKLRDQNVAAICDWDIVEKITECCSKGTVENPLGLQGKRGFSYAMQIDEEDLKIEARCRILKIVKGLIWERFEQGQLEAYGANILSKAVNESLDSLNKKVNLFDFIEMYFAKPGVLSLYTRLAKKSWIGRFFKNLIVKKMIFIYDVSTSLIEITKELKSVAKNIAIQPFAIDSVLEEFNESQKKAHDHLSKLEDQFLPIIKYITTKRHVTKILMAQRQFITERYDRGILEAKEYEKLSSEIDKKLHNLNKMLKVKWEAPTFSNLIATSPILKMLPQEDIERIIESSKRVVIKQGEAFDGVYLITKGEVEMSYNQRISRRGVGHLVSLMNLVIEDEVSRMNCVASHEVEAHKLSMEVLKEIMKKNGHFEKRVYMEAVGEIQRRKNFQLSNSKIEYFKEGDVMDLSYGAFIFSGTLKRKKKVYKQYDMVGKSGHGHGKGLLAQSDGVLIKFLSCQEEEEDDLDTPTGFRIDKLKEL